MLTSRKRPPDVFSDLDLLCVHCATHPRRPRAVSRDDTMFVVKVYVPVDSKTAHPPPPRAIPGHLTRVKLRTVGNLTQNEARPVGHLTFVSKRLSAVGNKRISQFFDSARAPLFTGHCSCRFHVGFSVVVVFISRGMH